MGLLSKESLPYLSLYIGRHSLLLEFESLGRGGGGHVESIRGDTIDEIRGGEGDCPCDDRRTVLIRKCHHWFTVVVTYSTVNLQKQAKKIRKLVKGTRIGQFLVWGLQLYLHDLCTV